MRSSMLGEEKWYIEKNKLLADSSVPYGVQAASISQIIFYTVTP